MFRLSAALGGCMMLGACMQTLPQGEMPPEVDRVEVVAVVDEHSSAVSKTESAAGAVVRKRGLFAGLFGGAEVADATEVPGEMPMVDAPVQSDAEDAARAKPKAPRRKGFLLFASRQIKPAAPVAESEVQKEPQNEQKIKVTEVTETTSEIIGAVLVKPRKGFRLFRKAVPANPDERNEEVAVAAPSEPEIQPDIAVPKRKRNGFMRLFASSSDTVKPDRSALGAGASQKAVKQRNLRHLKGPDKRQVAFGTGLPYGEIARVCEVSNSKLGKVVHKASGYTIRDSQPGNTEPHAFYLTGFSDGCARQLTAALVVFGSASMHEMIRYGLPSGTQPYSATDKSYEKIKRAVCGVGRKKPCGTKVGLIEKNTVFVSYYENFKGNRSWANILLHDGLVVAADSKKGRKG